MKISVVEYLNSQPFLFGLTQPGFAEKHDISLDFPARCAQRWLNREVEVGLIPVAVYNLISGHKEIITNYCIGCDGPVWSVCLFSEVPLSEIKQVYLDYQSRTSVTLLRILAQNYWETDWEYLQAEPGYEQHIGGTTAGLIIGDRAMDLLDRFEHIYDLGDEWKKFTGLPFVFAVWAANAPLPLEVIHEFEHTIANGLNRKAEVVEKWGGSAEEKATNLEYLQHAIKYDFGEEQRLALQRYQELLAKLPALVH